MLDISYSITGADAIDRDLARLRLDSIRGDIADIIDEMAGDLANYPPPPAGSRYVRTNRLHDEWLDGQTLFPQSSPTVLEAVRENSTSYGPFVQGAEDQAEVHQGRWRTTDAVMAAWEDRVAAAVEEALGKLVGV